MLSGGISMKLGTSIHYMSGRCWNGFQGQRSKVEVIARLNALFRLRDSHWLTPGWPLFVRWRRTDRWCSIEADLFLLTTCVVAWCVISVVYVCQ